MENGKLTVTGKSHIVIELKAIPKSVYVEFDDEIHVIPCNHGFLDWLKYKVEGHGHGHGHHFPTLRISWHVSGIREIVWRVHYK